MPALAQKIVRSDTRLLDARERAGTCRNGKPDGEGRLMIRWRKPYASPSESAPSEPG